MLRHICVTNCNNWIFHYNYTERNLVWARAHNLTWSTVLSSPMHWNPRSRWLLTFVPVSKNSFVFTISFICKSESRCLFDMDVDSWLCRLSQCAMRLGNYWQPLLELTQALWMKPARRKYQENVSGCTSTRAQVNLAEMCALFDNWLLQIIHHYKKL